MSNYQVDICHIQTSELESLSSKETLKLIKDYQKTKDENIKEQLVLGNLKLVLSIVQKYKQDELNDLFQVGCIGLIKAIEQFDLNLNVMFSTYAVPLIIGEVKAFNRNKSLLHVSRYIRDLSFKVSKLKETHLQKNHKEISKNQLLNELNISSFDLFQIENLNAIPSSFSEPKGGQEHLLLSDVIEDQKMSMTVVNDKICLENAMNSLTEKDKWLIYQRYYNDKTQAEIAEELCLSQAQVSRIEKRILNHLKSFFI